MSVASGRSQPPSAKRPPKNPWTRLGKVTRERRPEVGKRCSSAALAAGRWPRGYHDRIVPRVLAIVAAYNEERFIGECLEHLQVNGVEAYLCDNESSDRTVQIAQGFLERGLRGFETIARDGTYRWQQILGRKEQLAAELTADWFIHLDADEILQSARADQTLADAIAEADAAGYNAVEFDELSFVATRESPDHDHPDYRRTMRWYYPFAPRPLHRVSAWKRQPKVD